MPTNLTPEQIAAIIGGTAGQGWNYRPAGEQVDALDGPTSQYGQSFSYRDPTSGLFDSYGAEGDYLNTAGDANKFSAADYLKFAALVAGAGALNGGLSLGGLGGGTAGTTAAGAGGGSWLSGVPAMNAADIAAVAGGASPAAGLALPEIIAGTGAAAAGGGALGSAAASKGGLWDSITSGAGAVNKALGGNLGGLLGAGLGAAASGDKEQTSSKDPWGPAQQWIKDNISSGQALQQQYQAQPFSQQQQTAYGNLGGLLNAINTMAPQMLAGPSANASGGNNFSRANPTKQLQGSDVMATNPQWAPGLLKFF